MSGTTEVRPPPVLSRKGPYPRVRIRVCYGDSDRLHRSITLVVTGSIGWGLWGREVSKVLRHWGPDVDLGLPRVICGLLPFPTLLLLFRKDSWLLTVAENDCD